MNKIAISPYSRGKLLQHTASLQRRKAAKDTGDTAPPVVHEVLRAPGQPLEPGIRAWMEPRFGQDFSRVRTYAPLSSSTGLTIGPANDRFEQEADRQTKTIHQPPEPTLARSDFSGVRVHTGPQAAQSAREINALAYTVSNHIVFAANQYAPQLPSGQQLLAHELTHVAQQTGHSLRVQRQAAGPAPAPANGGLTDEMLRQIAWRLRDAMAGLGTDEEAIYSALSGRTQEQVNAIARMYEEIYSRSLLSDLQDELNESELMHLGIFNPEGLAGKSAADQATGFADVAAFQLDKAMRGMGTDEEAIFATLTGRTEVERQAIKEAYKRRTNRELEADLKDELSDDELTEALMLLNQGLLKPEDELYLAMAGLGTDEETIFRVLDTLAGDNGAILNMEQAYRQKYGDVIDDLRGDLNASEYARAMKILGPVLQDVAFEECGTNIIPQVRALIPVGIQKVEKAISVLSQGWTNMTPDQKTQFIRFFDPSGSGFDAQFVEDVLDNFRKIRREFNDDLVVECETSAGLCSGGRLYYTYWSNIHVCPYFTTETDTTRKERDFVHELAHNALMAVDRPYYSPSSTEYAALTPRGPWTTRIPVFGALARLISRTDTLYHPDAYSWFAFEVI